MTAPVLLARRYNADMQGPRLVSHSVEASILASLPDTRSRKRPSYEQARSSSSIHDAAKDPDEHQRSDSSANTPPGRPPSKLGSDGNDELDGALPVGPKASRYKAALAAVKRHAHFVGPGVIASIDPGNWATDLKAGSQYGYAHLFVILASGLIALLFQILSCRLGSVTGLDLAQHCRQAFHNRPKNTRLWRWGVLYPLYGLAEIGIIFTDLAELLGSAIAINLLVPKIPLYACVLLTSFDVFLILLMFNNYPTKMVTRSMRLFELMIGLLVLVVLASFVALLVRVSPVWKDVFRGYVPSKGFISGGGLYVAVGILGATAMPHAFFIGSKMATMRRLQPSQYEEVTPAARDEEIIAQAELQRSPRIHLHLPQPVRLDGIPLRRFSQRDVERASVSKEESEGVAERPSLACVKAHLPHAVVDIVGSLVGFAILINSSILILSAAVFYYGDGKSTSASGVSDLFDAYELVKAYIGSAFAFLFAIALLAAGQSASLTVTLSGQIISEGFLRWRTTPWKRRLITRSIGIVPSVAVAAAVGREGIDVLLVGSQVALSIVLPFVIAPLVLFTTSHALMSLPQSSKLAGAEPPSPPNAPMTLMAKINPFRRRRGPQGWVSFANGTGVVYLCWILWCVITAANVYALYDVGKGDS